MEVPRGDRGRDGPTVEARSAGGLDEEVRETAVVHDDLFRPGEQPDLTRGQVANVHDQRFVQRDFAHWRGVDGAGRFDELVREPWHCCGRASCRDHDRAPRQEDATLDLLHEQLPSGWDRGSRRTASSPPGSAWMMSSAGEA